MVHAMSYVAVSATARLQPRAFVGPRVLSHVLLCGHVPSATCPFSLNLLPLAMAVEWKNVVSADLAAVTDPTDTVVQLIQQASADKRGIVQTADKLIAALTEKDLSYNMPIHCRAIGFDRKNRDGVGGSPLEVLVIADQIAELGFSWAETRQATCVEIEPGDTETEALNVKISSHAGMAPVEPNSIMYGAMASGHLNYVLRCIAAGVEATSPLLSEDGHMSLPKLRLRDPDFASAVENGLRWTVLRWQVRKLYPEVLQVIQLARNMPAQINRAETEMQGLLRLHSLASTEQMHGADVDWKGIKKMALMSRPPWAENIDYMISFVVTKSGASRANS